MSVFLFAENNLSHSNQSLALVWHTNSLSLSCLTESVANPPRFQRQQPNIPSDQFLVSEQTTKGLARPQGCRYLIYIRCVCPGYIRAYVCSCPDFPNKAQELLSSRLRGQSQYLGFPSFSFTALCRSLPRLFSVVSCGLVIAPGMNPAERHEKGEMKENENDRTGWTKLRVGSGRAGVLFSPTNCYRRSSMGDIKRQLEPNYAGARAWWPHYIASSATGAGNTVNCVGDYIAGNATDLSLFPPARFTLEQLLSVT